MEGAGRKGKEETEKVCEKRTGERRTERKTKGKRTRGGKGNMFEKLCACE